MQETTPYVARLTDRSVLRISGPDANDFLNGLVTADVARLADGASCHGGLLTPQGKILYEFIIARNGDCYLIDVAKPVHVELLKRLGFYKMRAAVELEIAGDFHVAALWGERDLTDIDMPGRVDPRLAAMGYRLIETGGGIEAAIEGCITATMDDYEKHRITLGVPEGIKDYPLGNTFPHEACFDQLAGVSFTKGCYVGQEVVSRMRHRGTARKRTIGIFSGSALPEAETPVLAGDRPIGVMGSSCGKTGIAMVRLDRVSKALDANTEITAAGHPVRLACPAWADFGLAQLQPDTESTSA